MTPVKRRTVVLTLLVLGVLGCRGRRAPTAPGGGLAGGGAAVSIAGAWIRTTVVQIDTDIITSETLWIFASDGVCERRVTTTSLQAGFSDVVTTGCTYTFASGRVTIGFTGSAGSVTFTAVVQGGSLFLDGLEFRRT